MTDLCIVGGGIAGLTAALYARRAGKSALVLEKETFGGQITSATRVENYPGSPNVSGAALADTLLAQALDAGAEIELESVTRLEKAENGRDFCVWCGQKRFDARAVIIASGAKHRPLGVAREFSLTGHGVSYCAVCDGAFHKGEDVAVAGGGNSAAQAALFLADLCKTVTVVQEFAHLSCDARDERALRARANIRLCLNAKVASLVGDTALSGLQLCDQATGAQTLLPVAGLFVCVGRMADNAPFADMLSLDGQGFIRAGEDCRTSVPGVFCAGDCRTKDVRQLTTAAADGAIAALGACRYIG